MSYLKNQRDLQMWALGSRQSIMLLKQAGSRVRIEHGNYTPETFILKGKTNNANTIITYVTQHLDLMFKHAKG